MAYEPVEPGSPMAEEQELLETFLAGSKLGRAMERRALHENLLNYDGLAINFDYYIKVEELLEMLSPEEPTA